MKFIVAVSSMLFYCVNSYAGTSSSLTLASDYLFNGLSQTGEKPALQMSLDWTGDNGIYAGIWGSNVDFGEGTEIEADVYMGYYTTYDNILNLDVGIAQYRYYGKGFSSDYNYAEVWAKFNHGNFNVNFWYAWDYFGTGAGHAIGMVTYTLPISDELSIIAGVDKSSSLDENKWVWEDNDKDYIHWGLTALYNVNQYELSFGIEGTDLDSYGETTLLLTVTRVFDF